MPEAPIITLEDGREVRLGRTYSDPETLKAARIRHGMRQFVQSPSGILLPEKEEIDWWATASEKCPGNRLTDILGNDAKRDCAFAAPEHINQADDACETCTPAPAVTTSATLSAYFAYTHNRDTGANLLDVLGIWQKTGITGYKIDAFLAIHPADEDLLKWSCDYLGPLYVACSLPIGWENQQKLWDKNAGRIIGGHAVVFGGYTKVGPWIWTWGRKVQCTWAGWHMYFDEAYATIRKAWTVNGTRKSPSGLNLAAIKNQLAIAEAQSA